MIVGPLILALALPAYAGGPVITEDMTETAPIKRGHSFKDAVPFIILGLVVAGLIAGGSDNCTQPEPTPEPVPPGGGC